MLNRWWTMENLAVLQYIFKNKDTSYFFNIDTVSYGNVIKKFNVYIYYKIDILPSLKREDSY